MAFHLEHLSGLVSGRHTVGGGAVLTGGPALCGSGLLQLYQGPHHGRQGGGPLPGAGLPLTLLLLPVLLLQRLLTLRGGRTPAEQKRVESRGGQSIFT